MVFKGWFHICRLCRLLLRNGHWGYHLTVRIRENLTIPNVLSVLRLAMLPTFVSLFADGRVVAGSWFFGLLASTDWIDGYIARRFNQVIADRTVFFVGIGAALYYDYLPMWFGIVILVREVSIAVLMVVATAMGMERFPVTRLGKWATFALMAAVPWITLGSAGGAWTVFTYMGWAVGIPGVFVSYKSFFEYLPSVRSHLASGRRS
jgi:cardiolipin synthase